MIKDGPELPLGFGMALAQNPAAMNAFCALPESTQQKIIDGTHQVSSREEMHAYVRRTLLHKAAL